DQRLQLAARVERGELLEAADGTVVDEDLRHRPPPAPLDDLRAQRIVGGDVELLERDAARLEQTLRLHAVRAGRRGVHLDPSHARKLAPDCTRGKRALTVAGAADTVRRWRIRASPSALRISST